MGRRKHATYSLYQHENGRWYGNFFGFKDVLGNNTRLAIAPEGSGYGTTDKELAEALAQQKADELRQQQVDLVRNGRRKKIGLSALVTLHLEQLREHVTDRWYIQAERHLETAVAFFTRSLDAGQDVDVAAIDTAHIQRYIEHLRQLPSQRGKGTISQPTQRHYLNSLSGLFGTAISEGYIEPGANPVGAVKRKPRAWKKSKPDFLEVHEAALLLEAARLYKPAPSGHPTPYLHEIVATFLLTGGRKSEVLGLRIDDIDFKRETVTFWGNDARRLKTDSSHRVVRLWPQLARVLWPLVQRRQQEGGVLLFPSHRTRVEKPLTNITKQFKEVLVLAKFPEGGRWLHKLRHTYCSARLQTLDGGAPVAPFTVAKELGHGGLALVERVYGHLGMIRHRSEHVEFYVEQHEKPLGARLRKLREAVPA